MNKMKSVIAIGLAISMPVVAQVRAAPSVAIQTSSSATVFVRGFCKFGMQFIATSLSKTDTSKGSGGVSVAQVMGKEGKPMACEEDTK